MNFTSFNIVQVQNLRILFYLFQFKEIFFVKALIEGPLIFFSLILGSISKEESLQNVADLDDPYADEPERPSWFIVNSEKPFNAEPPLPFLVKNFITPS